MTITIKFFASLREQTGITTCNIEQADTMTVRDVWNSATDSRDLPNNILAAVNLEYVDWSHVVAENDEVAFFPPVTGG